MNFSLDENREGDGKDNMDFEEDLRKDIQEADLENEISDDL